MKRTGRPLTQAVLTPIGHRRGQRTGRPLTQAILTIGCLRASVTKMGSSNAQKRKIPDPSPEGLGTGIWNLDFGKEESWLKPGLKTPRLCNSPFASSLADSGFGLAAVLFESFDECLSDDLRRATLEVAAFEHLNELAVLQKSDRGRRRGIARKVFACRLGRVDIGTGENRDRPVRMSLARLQGHRNTGANPAGRASADRIYDDHQCAFGVRNGLGDGLARLRLFNAEIGKFGSHAVDHYFGIRHYLCSFGSEYLSALAGTLNPDLFVKYRKCKPRSQARAFRLPIPRVSNSIVAWAGPLPLNPLPMAIETEKKYRLDKPAMVAMADKLRELGAVFVTERFEQNFMYRNGIPDETNAVLRIRKIGESTFLTYKERIRNESEFKTKIEHETLVSDAEEMEFIVAKLGYKLVVVYEKHRKTFHLGECEVVLDELPFGQYMEIEGEPDEILTVEKMLGAEAFQTESRGYSRLTAKFGKDEDGVKTARFERAHTA